jgi:ATP-dependent exoDNAse (exonuclease V) beta subunit
MPVHDFIAKGMEHKQEVDFENWLMSFDISLSFQNIRKKSLYEAVEIIISKFLSPNLAEGGGAYVQYFLDMVLERDVRNQAGISDFLNFWGKNAEKFSIPSPEGNNAVRIMTIHKSKGLEFPVVIMPFAEEDYSRKPKDKLWLDGEEMDFGLPKVLIDNSAAVEGFGVEAKSVYDQKKQEELLDNINVLYVALTRAEEQLYVISNMNLTSKGEVKTNDMSTFFINYLMNYAGFDESMLEYEFGSQIKLSSNAKHVDTSKKITVVAETLDPKNIKIAQREALMWGTHQQESIEYGNVVHEILSFVKTKEDVDLAVHKAIETGLINFGQKELVSQTIRDIVNHKELELFFAKGNTVLNEQTIIQKEGTTIKPDRMVVTNDDEVYLLDYKTGIHNSKYQKQLENYQYAIELMGYKVVKKSLIYIGKQIDVVNL